MSSGLAVFPTDSPIQQAKNLHLVYDAIRDFGAVGDGSHDDTAAIQNALNTIPANSVLIIGNHRLHGTLTVSKNVTFRGSGYVNGNDTGASTNSKLYFDVVQTSSAYITATANLAIEYCTITGNSGSTTGISISGYSLILEHATIQGFTTGISVSNGYYCKLNNSYIGYSDYPIIFNNCYDINMVGVMLHANITAIQLQNSSYLRMFGGSVEAFNTYGIELASNSSVDFFGTYFEGNQTAGNGSCIHAEDGASIGAYGCQVYLTTCAYFVDARNATTSLRLISKGNRFNYPTDTSNVEVYNLLANIANYDIDISGDNWSTSAGANVIYSTITQSNGASGLVGCYRIIFPTNHPLFGQNVNTMPFVMATGTNVPGSPVTGTLVAARNNGSGTTPDPVGIHGNFGYNPYTAVYNNAQWEKVGCRIANQTNLAGTAALSDVITAFNNLLTAMRNNGVMV